MLTLRTLGRLELLDGERRLRTPRVREAALLVYIASSGKHGIARESLAEMFWPTSSQAHALHSLSQALYRLTRDAPGFRLDADRYRVRIPPGMLTIDALEFRAAMLRGDHVTAEALYEGGFLPSLSADDASDLERWVEEYRREISSLARELFADRLAAAERQGDLDAALAAVTALLRLDPYDQNAAAGEIGLLLQRGARAEAANRYDAILTQLASIGCSPSSRLEDLGSALRAEVGSTQRSTNNRALPFVGRRKEFTRLASALADAQAGRGNVIAVAGPAGMGKTRLCQQVLRLAAIRGFRSLAASCAPLEEGLPYSGMKQLLAELRPAELAVLTPSTVQLLAHVLPVLDNAPPEPPGNEPPPDDAVSAALAAVLHAVARVSPLLIVIEDVHWIDASTRAFLERFVGSVKRSRMLLLLSARSEELALQPTAKRRLFEAAEQLRISEFDRDEVIELVAAFNGVAYSEVPPERAAVAIRRAGGHPFFLVELLRESERHGIDITPASGLIPDPIGQFLVRRFEVLPPQATRVADALAVLGGSATHTTLQSVAGISGEDFAGAVEDLVRHGHIREGESDIAFLHDLVREAAYRRLSVARRSLLHARAVKSLRSVRGIDLGTLAVHAKLAGDSHATYRYAVAAGSRAEARLGHITAEPYWRMAEEHAPTGLAKARARAALANSLYYASRNREAERLYTQLLEAPVPLSKQLLYRARVMAIRSRVGDEVSSDDVRVVLEKARTVPGVDERLDIFHALIFVMTLLGDLDGVHEAAAMIGVTASAARDGLSKVLVLTNVADVCGLSGRLAEAEQYTAAAMAAAQTKPHLLGLAKSARAAVFFFRGDLPSADAELEEATTLLFGGEYLTRHATILSNWGAIKTELGDFEAARSCFDRALAMAAEDEVGYAYSMALCNQALAEYESGDAEAAAKCAEHTLAVAKRGPRHVRATAGAVLGLLALRGSFESADGYRSSVIADMPANWAGADLSYANIFLARMDERQGNLTAAVERINSGVTYYANRDFCCHGRLELEKGRLIGLTEPDGGLALARAVRARALDKDAVLLLNRAEELIHDLRRQLTGPQQRGLRTGSAKEAVRKLPAIRDRA